MGKLQALMNKGDTDPLAGLLLPGEPGFYPSCGLYEYAYFKDQASLFDDRSSDIDVVR